ncbi:hypothetical protein BS47DRAFT_1356390 [Hydnum rufescens UP504]|uniref:Uncharacterized protein n=1 Tax=Hydnum rufescens UP504 TaxID=1448309 RepID=A0A9P6AE01_9AGAM|nr:hypothetical protein BS47DRAFT_1356390 [Hydnum rufescens UP504]
MPPTPPSILQTSDCDICIWVTRSANRIEDLRRCGLRDIELWKDDSGVGHEILVAEFRHPAGRTFVAVERSSRSPPDASSRSSRQSISAAGSTQSLGASRSSSAMVSAIASHSTLSAVDYIWIKSIHGAFSIKEMVAFVRPKNPQYKRVGYLGRLQRPGPRIPNVLDLTYAAWAAHNTRINYNAHIHNCYWYCNAILHILKAKFGIELNKEAEAGRYNARIMTVSLGNLKVDELVPLTDRYERYMNGNWEGGQTDKERTQAEAERAAAIDAARREAVQGVDAELRRVKEENEALRRQMAQGR